MGSLAEKKAVIDTLDPNFKTKESEKRKTNHSETANRLAIGFVAFYFMLVVIHYLFGIGNVMIQSRFDKIETIVALIVGFYFGKRLDE